MRGHIRSKSHGRIRWGVLFAVLCVAAVGAYLVMFTYNTARETQSQDKRPEPQAATPTAPVVDVIDPVLDAKVKSYKALFSGGQYESGIDEAERLQPELESFVGSEQQSVRPPGFIGFRGFWADGLTRFLGPGSESSPIFTDLSAGSYSDRRGRWKSPFPSVPTIAVVRPSGSASSGRNSACQLNRTV